MQNIKSLLQKEHPELKEFLEQILCSFMESDCADSNFATELSSDNGEHFFSRVWEAILYKRFHDLNWDVIGLPKGGPDFQLTNTPCNKKIYVEATVPEPEGLPEEWLRFKPGVAISFPYEEMLLRWTSSFKAKSDKHLKDMNKSYIDAGLPFVIAINSCRLSRMADDYGISQWPFAVEAVFPVGPITIPLDSDTGEAGEAYQSLKFTVTKPGTGTNIPTYNFLTPEYNHVSALLGCSACFVDKNTRAKYHGLPPMFLVHNPLAKNPLPAGWLPGAIEYVAERIAKDEYVLKRMNHSKQE